MEQLAYNRGSKSFARGRDLVWTLPWPLGSCPEKEISCLYEVPFGTQLCWGPLKSPGGALLRWLRPMWVEKSETWAVLWPWGLPFKELAVDFLLAAWRGKKSLSATVFSLLQCLWWVSWAPIIHLEPFSWNGKVWISICCLMLTCPLVSKPSSWQV